jgi:mono/diheme cytochrome c family protein
MIKWTKRTRTAAVFTAVILSSAVVLTGYLKLASAGPEYGLFEPNDRDVVSRGEIIYAENCASCHGANLEGEENWRRRNSDGRMPAPPHDETGHTWHHPDQQLFDITKYGLANLSGLSDYESDMPVYEGILSDAEIIAVLSFIKSRWPQEIRERHDEMNRRSVVN